MGAWCGRSTTRYDLVQFVHMQISPRAAGPPRRQSPRHQEPTQSRKVRPFYELRSRARRGAADWSAGLRAGPIRGTSALPRSTGLLQGLVTPLLAVAKCALESVYYRKSRTIECVLHLSRGQDRPPVREHCASAAVWAVRCPCAQSTLHKANFLMRRPT